MIGRFAPTTSGPAHPGSLLAALLNWLDIRSLDGTGLLRLEDLDPSRCRPEFAEGMRRDLAWLGVAFDREIVQSDRLAAYEAALDTLAAQGRLYPCTCSRKDVRAGGLPARGGGWRYPGTCRGQALPPGGWRESAEPLRFRLPEGELVLRDEAGVELGHDPSREFGDPIVRRRDGSVAYHLASVVDDAADGVTRIIRGRDLADTTATQVRVQEALGLPRPRYRHHLLLLEEGGGKLAKLHGSVAVERLRPHFDGPAFCGVLAQAAGLQPEPRPVTPEALLRDFSWERVATRDVVLRFDGEALHLEEPRAAR